MSTWLVGLVTVAYASTAVALWFEGRAGLSIMFAGYAFANLGLIYDVVGGVK